MNKFLYPVMFLMFGFLSTAEAQVQFCQGGRFKPCVCADNVTKLLGYRPSMRECNGNAGIILRGRYRGVFSAVVRDGENRDRWPANGVNGCTSAEVNSGVARCSVFKSQRRVTRTLSNGQTERIECLGARGNSPLFRNVRRITLKFKDIPNSSNDPLGRFCLFSPTRSLN